MNTHPNILEFARFLDYYSKNYSNSITELSKRVPKSMKKCRFENNNHSYFKNNFQMLDFDLIVCESKAFKDDNRPSSFDGLYYQIYENKLYFYLIEFKDTELNRNHELEFKKLENKCKDFYKFIKYNKECYKYNQRKIENYNNYIQDKISNISKHSKNSVEFSLRVKALESLQITLPSLYKEFYKNNPSSNEINIYSFLTSDLCEVNMYTAGKFPNYFENGDYFKKIYSKVQIQYDRLKYYYPNIITDGKLFSEREFNTFLNCIKDNEKHCQRTLNSLK